ncbi:InlB B-repeat-containing protein, partial [Hominenteromicrobium sp.]|uniref:InlB B-repeat-containing protein n=1 Tax=Hominenteromicrobium sp. TaxID=3073581 RepID=UPI003A8EF1CB
MKKRILSILLLCCMVLTLLPTTAFAAGELPDVKLSVPTTFDKTVDLTKQNGELKIKDSKTYLIKGSTDPNWYFQHRIKIDGKNNTPHIFLDGVRLQAPEDGPAIELYGGASACLYFIGGDSELIGAENFAALQKNKTDGYLRVLVQTGTKLTCEGGRYGAGIGGSKVGIKNFSQGHGMNLHFGSLATGIYGGEILATSGVYGAGIGGGANGGVGEWIYVYSGKLTVRSVSEGAGIGGGQGGPGRFIYIKGGTVNAGSESGGAGIGSGDQDGQNKSEDAHHIEISGGTVEAWSNYAGAGIGGGRGGSGYDISITGGVVRAQGYLGAGIGGGMNGNSGNILIKDTTLTALAFPLYQDYGYTELSASAVGRGSNRAYYMAVMQDQEFAMIIEENIKIGASDGKSVWLSATGWQWRHNQEPYKKYWGTTTELLIPNENGRVDLQRLSLPYAYNYGRVISKLELRCEESTCSHEFGWVNRDGCHIWACVNCGARDPAAENSKQNAKHIPGDWGNQKQLCTVCGHVMGTDTKAPVLEGLKDGESYTVEDTLDGKPGAYTFTVSDPAASGETSSGIKSVTINGEPQDGPTYRLPAPDGGNNDAGAKYTVVATDNAGNETTATVRTYRQHHVKVISPDGNGTASASPDKAVAGTEITLTATPKEDYRFKEWQVVSPAGLVITNNKFTMPNSNVEVKAIFEEDEPPAPTEHTVRFNANGGGGTMADVTGVSGSYTLPACGFTEPKDKQFKGWSTGADGSVISGTTYEVSSDTTFYAIWESKEYSIIVTDGKATIGAGSEISKATQGTTITLTANAAPDGKVFDKWVVESGSATLEDANSETTTFIMPDSEVSVKATYKNAPHTHTYDQEIQKPETLKSAADCTNDAVYFKSCSCGEISTTETFTAAGTQLGHAWASNWSKDTDNHWKECSRCHEKKDEAAHDYGSDNICDTCGYDKTVPHTHNLTLVPAKAATEDAEGNIEYWYCEGCNKYYSDKDGTKEIKKADTVTAKLPKSPQTGDNSNLMLWIALLFISGGAVISIT